MNQKKTLPNGYPPDQCFRYIPRHNYSTFREQVELTQGELLNYLPIDQYHKIKQFESVKSSIAIGFWTTNAIFVTFCHRIPFLSRHLGSGWGMFIFKVAVFGVMYLGYRQIQKNAIQQQLRRVYRVIEDDYRKFKNSGDILMLNPKAIVYDDLQKAVAGIDLSGVEFGDKKSSNLA